jgi:hypothetical protein
MERDAFLSMLFADGKKGIEWRPSFFIWAFGPLLAVPVPFGLAPCPVFDNGPKARSFHFSA